MSVFTDAELDYLAGQGLIVRIRPTRVIAFGIESAGQGMNARSVGPA
jgi:hypothetical protein